MKRRYPIIALPLVLLFGPACTRSGDWPARGELPDCGPLPPLQPWFVFDDFDATLRALGYVAAGEASYPGEVVPTAEGVLISLPSASVGISWRSTLVEMPFEAGERVSLHALYNDYDRNGGLVVTSEETNALVAAFDGAMWNAAAELEVSTDLACEYRRRDARLFLPPLAGSSVANARWNRVFGRSVNFTAGQDALSLDRPGVITAPDASPISGWVDENWVGLLRGEDRSTEPERPMRLDFGAVRQP